jgi:hypothetical protein
MITISEIRSALSSRRNRVIAAAFVGLFGLGAGFIAAAQSASSNLPKGALTGGRAVVQTSTGAAATSAASFAREGVAQKPADGMHQGLTMHGHWIIDIKDPDGTPRQHHEFENSIQYDGQNYLIGLMSGYGAAGPWEIYFSNAGATTAGSPCNTGNYPYCAIVYSTTTTPGQFACSIYTCASGLTITPTFGAGPTLTLSGSIAATQAGTIGFVATGMNACGQTGVASFPTAISTVSPATCYTSPNGGTNSIGNDFGGTATSTTLSAPISVAKGQLMQITVVLSFS